MPSFIRCCSWDDNTWTRLSRCLSLLLYISPSLQACVELVTALITFSRLFDRRISCLWRCGQTGCQWPFASGRVFIWTPCPSLSTFFAPIAFTRRPRPVRTDSRSPHCHPQGKSRRGECLSPQASPGCESSCCPRHLHGNQYSIVS